ncbi:HlyD family secretion protein [Bosea caraganae]|uniref:HlyD family secretion protein n=1 Tax=Bosea caraganae TaxID=2763117 RepID=A0A370L2Y8_9HYPH|nr:HlyD family secretion protein [Bosea caraganae]RDJ22440.1 HlyD family secretion protein [Bosea caraganae]RDJ30399.1 HlyD family secretion protein [Bosea caraganae]
MSAETLTEKPQGRDRLKLVEPVTETAAPEPQARQAAEAPLASTEAPAGQKPARKIVRKLGLTLLAGAALTAGAYYGLDWWRNGRFIVTTDDAYVGVEMATVSAKLSANVTNVAVARNQQVKAGQLLVALDDGDQRIALDSAKAKSATAVATLLRIDSQIEAGKASLLQAQAQANSAQADIVRANADFDRASKLAASSYGSQANLDAATATRDKARAAIANSAAGVTAAEANVKVLEAQRNEAARQADELKVAEEKAARDLSFTKIYAPIDGLVANTGVQLGDLVSPGKRLMSVVPLDQVYVDANFKETQVGELKIGDRAKIKVDAFDGHSLDGTVSGIAGGTGSVFSLLPPDNATGNFTKIVQRLPIRIALTPEAIARGVLRPGMSVVVSIDPRPATQH